MIGGKLNFIMGLFGGNKKEVAKLKRKVTTTKKQLEKAGEAVKTDDADEAVKFLKKFSN